MGKKKLIRETARTAVWRHTSRSGEQRICKRVKSLQEYSREVNALTFLEQQGYPAPRLLGHRAPEPETEQPGKIEMEYVDGVPLNLRSHGHGQGYLDVNGLLPEVVERIVWAWVLTIPCSALIAAAAWYLGQRLL